MSHETSQLPPPLDLSGWRKLPTVLMVVGAVFCLLGGLFTTRTDFGYAWLLAFVFYYSLALGALFLVLIHHLTDAGWSVGIRRFNEHIASLLFPWRAILFLPVGLLGKFIYSWMKIDPKVNNLVAAKFPVFTTAGFWVTSGIFFAIWWLLTSRLTFWSQKQDQTGEAICTHKMRFYSGWGIVVFALTLTFSAVLWVKALQYQWFSAIYGVYFFGSSAWIALATTYIIAVVLQRQRILSGVLQENYFYFIGVLFFAFTVFQAYIEFAQYFVVWNANMPQETFYYIIREHARWWSWSMILIFGHFFVPFFILLPAKIKTNFKVMVAVCIWAWFMHALDLGFNMFPAYYDHGYPLRLLWLPLGCLLFMGGFLAAVFLKKFNASPAYPLRDPRLHEAMGIREYELNDATNPGGAR